MSVSSIRCLRLHSDWLAIGLVKIHFDESHRSMGLKVSTRFSRPYGLKVELVLWVASRRHEEIR